MQNGQSRGHPPCKTAVTTKPDGGMRQLSRNAETATYVMFIFTLLNALQAANGLCVSTDR
jgi:hypothetical protein